MIQIISKLHSILNQFKGIETAYTVKKENQMIMKIGTKNYKLVLEELGEGSIVDYIQKLCNDEV